MPNLKKWEIPGLDGERHIKSGASKILSHRLHTVLEWASRFRLTHDVEDLHQLRIAIRRLRYPLEALMMPFRRKLMLKFITELNTLQDAAGHARDSDVLIERLCRDKELHHWRISKRILEDLEAQRILLYRQALDAIDLFLVSTLLYEFRNEIRYAGHLEDFGAATGDPAMGEQTKTNVEPDIHTIDSGETQ